MNSMLSMYGRPTVIFDVSDKTHREWAHTFMKNRTWSGCPVQFALPVGEDNVYTMMMRLLTGYYIQKEFGELPKDDYDRALADALKHSPKIVWRKHNK
jgi:hypothetical protein